MNPVLRALVALLAAAALVMITASEARGYLGPGGVFAGIGAFLALVAALSAALFGFVWYPAKRFVRWMRARQNPEKPEPSTTSDHEG